MQKQTRVGLIAGAVAFFAAVLYAGPAFATDGDKVGTETVIQCVTTTHGSVSPFVNRNAADTANTNGTATLTADGVKLVQPDNDAKVYGYFTLSSPPKLKDIYGAGFANINTSGLAPSYQLGLYSGDTWLGTLVWESVYQDSSKKSTVDVLHGGDSKWWLTKDYGPGSYTKATQKSYDGFVKMLPENTVAKYYGINVGAGGIATNTVNDLVLKTKAGCTKHTWNTKYTSASPTVSTSPNTSASPTPSMSKSASPSATTSPAAALPVTGPGGIGTAALVGLGLVVVGGIGIVVSRLRRKPDPQFVAE